MRGARGLGLGRRGMHGMMDDRGFFSLSLVVVIIERWCLGVSPVDGYVCSARVRVPDGVLSLCFIFLFFEFGHGLVDGDYREARI